MAVPADKPGSPMDWFNKNAAKLEKQYPDQWVIMSGNGVELHGKDLEKLLTELEKKGPEAQNTWTAAFIPKPPKFP